MQRQRLLAVDPSLTCSGWAFFDSKAGKVLAVGKIRSLSATIPLADRLVDLQNRIEAVMAKLKLGSRDTLICEAPTTMRDPRAAIKVEQVRCIFEVLARTLHVQVPGRINPRTVHHELLGFRGRQVARPEVKRAAVQVVRQLFSTELEGIGFDPSAYNLSRHQDIVDALLIGYIGLTRQRTAQWAETPLKQLMQRRGPRAVVSRG
ncbi:MAG: hypothetical protein EBZ48_12555 [Proteobacteria bacterium]|nr:hypothetical protein [Pseudomonadota bacterium]